MQSEWITTRLPRRVLAVRMRSHETLCLPTLATPFHAVVLACEANIPVAVVRRVQQQCLAAVGVLMEPGGPASDDWHTLDADRAQVRREREGNGAAAGEAPVRHAAAAIHSLLCHSGAGIETTDFVVIGVDGTDAIWDAVLTAIRDTLAQHPDERLHRAAAEGRVHEVRHAIAAGWPLEEFDDLDRAPLHWAATAGEIEIVRCLLAAGVDGNRHREERSGETPLGAAVATASPDLVRVLLEAGADPRIAGWMQITALLRAEQRTDPDGPTVRALLEASRAQWDARR